ncbi:hypothetical protein ASPNIDRAFT_38201 [Aspergillus niger ATCC 1015]|uniref:Uncharacterized protein n=1 Tax=Aspergillus niger (strain ATCC 1015 / CBS 113.46 / FGSC A1144 / LSHB Ac4 / NCTC 3858a / NRRL 328 / USDA 3528.7) TaxID=380704 RepID=G3YHK0_ASPNA|nr:uncharacterized protein BO96DRAFT_332368 [Aspergillus niger CBS 101883]EHA18197.1 hypothetical protein ASPNIDRAFT_38201 [Aspergillus niger ATCC 1015]PYH58781.1 hypothetical protein BO96DRAFT_332368 [Aspergillus niger CBS 101883]
MEADGGWGVMDDLLSQRTALQCADPASQQPAPRYREAPMGLFLAQRTARKGPADAWDYSSDGQRRRRPVEANRPGGPRSFQDSLGFAAIHPHSFHSSIHLPLRFPYSAVSGSLPLLFYAFGFDGYRVRFILLLRWPDAHEVPVRYPAKGSFSLCLSFPLIQAPKLQQMASRWSLAKFNIPPDQGTEKKKRKRKKK